MNSVSQKKHWCAAEQVLVTVIMTDTKEAVSAVHEWTKKSVVIEYMHVFGGQWTEHLHLELNSIKIKDAYASTQDRAAKMLFSQDGKVMIHAVPSSIG